MGQTYMYESSKKKKNSDTYLLQQMIDSTVIEGKYYVILIVHVHVPTNLIAFHVSEVGHSGVYIHGEDFHQWQKQMKYLQFLKNYFDFFYVQQGQEQVYCLHQMGTN